MDTKIALKQLNLLGGAGSSMRLAAEEWTTPFQTLIAIILSARTRDETTIKVALNLFKKFSDAKKLAKANLREIQTVIRPLNFYKNKSKNIVACAQALAQNYNGNVPKNFEELIKLPGVGRKTANVFLSEFGKSEIGIDTHVHYITRYLGWTKNTTQEKIEKDLKALFPNKLWGNINPTLVRFGKTHTSRIKKNKLLDEIKRVK